MTQLGLLPTYLMDASSIVELDGKHKAPSTSPTFTPKERVQVWDGLEMLTKDGRLKLIKQVKTELALWNPDGLRRLTQYPGHKLVIRRTPNIVLEYQSITAKYKDIRPKPGRDKADPWLVLACKLKGFCIICEELSLVERTSTAKDLRIPDICKMEGLIRPLKLREFANHQGWIS